MTTLIQTASTVRSDMLAIAGATFLGLGLIFAAGLAQSAVLHDAAHDSRHAIAFPCH